MAVRDIPFRPDFSHDELMNWLDRFFRKKKQYELGRGIAAKPTTSEVVMYLPMCRVVVFEPTLYPSRGKASVAATAQTDFDIQKNGSSFGTMRFAAAGTVASFISANGATFDIGDIISVIAPASVDATLSGIGFILAGTHYEQTT